MKISDDFRRLNFKTWHFFIHDAFFWPPFFGLDPFNGSISSVVYPKFSWTISSNNISITSFFNPLGLRSDQKHIKQWPHLLSMTWTMKWWLFPNTWKFSEFPFSNKKGSEGWQLQLIDCGAYPNASSIAPPMPTWNGMGPVCSLKSRPCYWDSCCHVWKIYHTCICIYK